MTDERTMKPIDLDGRGDAEVLDAEERATLTMIGDALDAVSAKARAAQTVGDIRGIEDLLDGADALIFAPPDGEASDHAQQLVSEAAARVGGGRRRLVNYIASLEAKLRSSRKDSDAARTGFAGRAGRRRSHRTARMAQGNRGCRSGSFFTYSGTEMSDSIQPVEGSVPGERITGWFARGWHDWDSFTPGCNWRDFTVVKIGGEWNHMTERVEAEVCLLGLWLKITYVWGDAFMRRMNDMREDYRRREAAGEVVARDIFDV